MDYKPIPTVRPSTTFDISKDSTALRNAMKGLGTDEQAIIEILTNLSNEQRQQLLAHYNATENRDLIKDLIDELSFRFEDVIVSLMMPPIDYLCKRLHDALDKPFLHKAENVCIEVLFPRSHNEVAKIERRYQEMYKRSLAEHICSKTQTDDFRSVLTSLLRTVRERVGPVDSVKAKKQAEELYATGEGKLHPNMEIFYKMLTSSNFAQLRLVFELYNDIAGHSVYHAIKEGMPKHDDIMLSIGE